MFEIFLTSSHSWFHVFDVQLYFVCAQRIEMLIFIFLILTLWFWLDFGVRCVGISTLQWVRKLKKKCPFCLHSHANITPCPFRVPQRGYIQPIAPAVTCFKARSQSSWVSFHWNVEKETYELWIRALLRALKNVTAGGTDCKLGSRKLCKSETFVCTRVE